MLQSPNTLAIAIAKAKKTKAALLKAAKEAARAAEAEAKKETTS